MDEEELAPAYRHLSVSAMNEDKRQREIAKNGSAK
jgi:hypothetical protein